MIVYNQEGDLLFSAAKDSAPHVWRSDGGKLLGSYNGHTGAVWSVSIDQTTKTLVTGSADQSIRMWDVQYGQETARIDTRGIVRSCDFSGAGTRFLYVIDSRMGQKSKLVVHSTDRDLVFEIEPPESKITVARWSLGDRFIYTGHEDGTVMAWEVGTGKLYASNREHSGAVTDFQLSHDKTFFITSSKDQTAKIFDAMDLAVMKTFHAGVAVNSASISPIRDEIILGGGQEAMEVTTTATRAGKFEARFYDLVYEQEVGRVKGHFGPINTIAYHPLGYGYASGAEDGYIHIYEFDASYHNFSYNRNA